MMASWPNPFALREPLAPRAARIRGCRFLWLLSFGQAKESNRRPGMVDEMHTDVSRFSQNPRKTLNPKAPPPKQQQPKTPPQKNHPPPPIPHLTAAGTPQGHSHVKQNQ